MINRFSHLFLGRGIVIKNFVALGILQGTNFLIPLIIMPHLVSTIGIDGYGLVSFIQAVMIYFYSFTDYGFAITATREIAINKNKLNKISSIFSTVLVTKIVLIVASAVFLIPLVLLIPQFKQEGFAFLLGFTIVLGQSILPVWFFQGMEKMKYITFLNLLSKILFTALIFMFVTNPSHYPLVLLFFGLGNLVSGLIGLFIAMKQFKLKFIFPSFADIKGELVNGWNLFVANFAIVSYMNSNVFILGLFTSNLIVGYYSIAEKIVMAMRQLLVVFSQAIYPHICQLATQAHLQIIRFYKQIFIPFILLFFFFSIGVFLTSEYIIEFLTKQIEPQIIFLLNILCFVPFIVGINIPAQQTLLAYKLQKSYTSIMIVGSLLNIVLNLFLASQLSALGTAISVICTEIFITVGLYYKLERKHKRYNIF